MRALAIAVFLVAVPVAAYAQNPYASDEPMPQAPPAQAPARVMVPDATWAAVKNRVIDVQMRDGSSLRGATIGLDAYSVTIAEDLTQRIVTLPRLDVMSVSFPTSIKLTLPPLKPRHFGLQTFQGPGNFMLDVEYGHFYGYVGTSIGYPIIFNGDGTDRYVGFVLGAGGTWKMGRSNWSFDLTGTLLPSYQHGFSMGVGVTAGFHYTARNGFTVGFKLPVFGVAPGCNGVVGDYQSDGCAKVTGGALIANYYLQAGMQLPIVSVGYRF